MQYEVLTPLSNGREPRIPVGSVVTMDADDARYLVTAKALRLVAGTSEEANEKASDEEFGIHAVAARLRAELGGKTHKQLDEMIADEKVGEVQSEGNKPTVAEKVEAIVAGRLSRILADMDRTQLLVAMKALAGAGIDAAAADVDDDEIRKSLMLAAAEAD